MNKTTIIIGIVLVLIALGLIFFMQGPAEEVILEDPNIPAVDEPRDVVATTTATTTDEVTYKSETVIGSSVEGKDIVAYHYGNGDDELLFIGGIHGGYSWNTVLLARSLMDYLESDETIVPDNITVTVIPVLNPDGLEKVVGTAGDFTEANIPSSIEDTIPGRFNMNNVDLNRNFDCDWTANGTWQKRTVSGGSVAFSEPEAKAIRDYVNQNTPEAAVVWYASVGGVFASNCHEDILPATLNLTNVYADASGYQAYEEFDFYAITGDMVNWFASQDIPAVSVLLTTHEDVEWDKNKRGVEAVIEEYTKVVE